ncbi:MAG: hypothetical protein JNN26_01450 [Candidatus Obscuribacter sp.]|nr:hypothetical protein [Candidatus Obscuribacter sp.]
MKNAKSLYILPVCLTLCAFASEEVRADNTLTDNPVTNMVKGVVGATGKVVKGTAKGAEILVKDAVKGTEVVVKGAAKGGEIVVKDAAKGGEAVLKGGEAVVKGAGGVAVKGGEAVIKGTGAVVKGTVHGAEAAASATGKAVGHAMGGSDSQVPGKSATEKLSTAPATPAAPLTNLIGSSLAVTIDGVGNIIDDTGRLVGRVNKDTTTLPKGSLSMSGRMMTVSVNSAGQMVDSTGNFIGHILGAEPMRADPSTSLAGSSSTAGNMAVTETAAPQPSSSWTDEDALKDAAPKLHGPIDK